MINWIPLTELSQLKDILQLSQTKPCLIFKHSTRCSISSMALNRLERAADESFNELNSYLLDLISYREISNAIADELSVEHQSPQIITIVKGKVVLHASHNAISANDILDAITV